MIELDMMGPGKAKKVLQKRLGQAREDRQRREERWDLAERVAYSTDGLDKFGQASRTTELGSDADPTTAISYAFKNLRFLHSQLSANPPVVIPRPSTSDPEDKRRARAADTVVRYSLRKYGLQEVFDACSLGTLVRGLGCIKVWWDSSLGEILSTAKSGKLVLEGDINTKAVSAWKLFLDTDAEAAKEIRWVIEEVSIPIEEALRVWPRRKEALEREYKNQSGSDVPVVGTSRTMLTDEGRAPKRESIKVFEYWETGLPTNAYLGRHTVFLEDGTLLQPLHESPQQFVPSYSVADLKKLRAGKKVKRKAAVAHLPYHFFTDIDVLESVWGKSFMDYEAPLQDLLNRVDTVGMENLQAHAVGRLILPDGVNVQPGQISNSPVDIIRMKTDDGVTGEPHFIPAMQMPAVWGDMRAQIRGGLDDMAGVNESMFGQASRETPASGMQYATNQGNVIRRRLFNKYVLLTEAVYTTILNLARHNWDDGRTLMVLGREKAMEVVDFKTSDIDGGFDLVVEYGTSLSLDPLQRRDELAKMTPLMKEAGVQPRKILTLMRLGELDDAADHIQMAEDRQREIFEKMTLTGSYIPPAPMMDHEGMIAYGMEFLMTADFDALDPVQQALVRRHIYERGLVAAMEKQGLTWKLLGLPQPPEVNPASPNAAGVAPGTPGPLPALGAAPGALPAGGAPGVGAAPIPGAPAGVA